LKFTNHFEALPSDGPDNHAHIVDVPAFKDVMDEGERDIKVWDAVATMLFKISPDTLKTFLNPLTKTFKLVHKSKYTVWSTRLVIWKKEQEVFVS
ncbi:hypothetical protein K469DRAFT_477822, partial [Zopfia rhizophila CBS 207.26]